jgi:hypothetical protein
VEDVAGNVASTSADFAVTVDTTAPTAAADTNKADGYYKAGETINITLTFTENVTLIGASGLDVTLNTGDVLNIAAASLNGTSNTVTAVYTVGTGDTSSDLTVATVALGAGATLTDAAGNAASLASLSANIAATHAIVIDTTAPTVSSEALTAALTAQNSYLNGGDVLTATVAFSEIVNVTGTPKLALNIGGSIVYANFATGSGTSALTFTYPIQSGQTDSDGIGIPTNALSLNGGTITDLAVNTATITSISVSDNVAYLVDTTVPGTPTIDVLASSDNGASSTDNISSISTPQVKVTLGAGTAVGDIVTLKAGEGIVGTFTLTSTEITNGNVTIAASTLGSQNTYVLKAFVTDAAGNVDSDSSPISYVLDSINDAPAVSFVGTTGSSITILAADADAEPNWTNLLLVNSLNGTNAVNDGSQTVLKVAAQSVITQVSMSVTDGFSSQSIDVNGSQVAVVMGTSLGEVMAPAEGKYGVYFGFQGNDTIYGSTGADIIWGGTGKDTMTGDYDADGTGVRAGDIFAFAAGDSGIISGTVFDVITDYAADDNLDLPGAATAAANVSGTDVATVSANSGKAITASIANGVLTVADPDANLIDSLTEWLAVARAMDTVDTKAVAFQFNGDTYVYQENSGGDLLIQLDNVVEVTAVGTSGVVGQIWIS